MGYLDILEEQVLQAKKIKDLMRLKKQKEEEDQQKKIKAKETYDIRLEVLRKNIPLPFDVEGVAITGATLANSLKVAEIDIVYKESDSQAVQVVDTLIVNNAFQTTYTGSIINYIYNLILKGNTFGRRFTKLRLDGNIKWYSLFTREFIYKGFFGLLTLPIDAYLITFSKSRKAIRDRVSGIYVVDESVRYPF